LEADSLLVIPSWGYRRGISVLALPTQRPFGNAHVGTAALGCPVERSSTGFITAGAATPASTL
jgi:hypothetical protein